MSTDQPSKQLDHKMIGSFDLIRKQIILLKLSFPQVMKIYNIFDPSFI